MAPAPSRRGCAPAFTLLELLVAVALGLFVVLTAAFGFRSATKALSTANRLALENQLLRAGMQQSLRETDFWGSYYNQRADGQYRSLRFMGDTSIDRIAQVTGGRPFCQLAANAGMRDLQAGNGACPGPHNPAQWNAGFPNGGWFADRSPQHHIADNGLTSSTSLFARNWGRYDQAWDDQRPLMRTFAKLYATLGWYGAIDYLPAGAVLHCVRTGTVAGPDGLLAGPVAGLADGTQVGFVWDPARTVPGMYPDDETKYSALDSYADDQYVQHLARSAIDATGLQGSRAFLLVGKKMTSGAWGGWNPYNVDATSGAWQMWMNLDYLNNKRWQRLLSSTYAGGANVWRDMLLDVQVANDAIAPDRSDTTTAGTPPKPSNWPSLRTTVVRFKADGRDRTQHTISIQSPVTGQVIQLSFSTTGTTLRGARRQWGRDL